MVQLIVFALHIQKLLVLPSLNNLSVFQNDNGVGIAHGGEPVGDDKYRPSLHQLIHTLFNQGLRPGIDAGGGFIQNQHRRVGHRRPGDGQQLPLALGKICPVPGDHSAVPLGQTPDEGIRIGDFGCPLDLLLGGVQLSETDIVGDGAGEKVRILEHDPQGAPQVVLLNLLHVYAVVDHLPSLDVVEAVDQVGDGGLSRAGGTHEGDLLSRLGVEADILQDHPAVVVAEGYPLKPHVASQGNQGSLRQGPGPAAGLLPAGNQPSRLLPDIYQSHPPIIHFLGLAHDLKDPLRPSQGRQQEIALHGELVDGHGCLAHENQVAGQASHVGEIVHGHDPSQHRHHRVIDVGYGHHRGHHGGGVALGSGSCLAQALVFLPEGRQILLLVVEDLDHLLAADHLLDVAVQVSQSLLLFGEIGLASLSAVADIQKHSQIAHHHQQGQPPVEDKQKGQGAGDLDEALNHHGEAVI